MFWVCGYEGIMFDEFKLVMGGIIVLSFYVVFGLKEVFFCEVVVFYW